jgi:hypothetical protein
MNSIPDCPVSGHGGCVIQGLEQRDAGHVVLGVMNGDDRQRRACLDEKRNYIAPLVGSSPCGDVIEADDAVHRRPHRDTTSLSRGSTASKKYVDWPKS